MRDRKKVVRRIAPWLEAPLAIRGVIGFIGDADVVRQMGTEGEWAHEMMEGFLSIPFIWIAIWAIVPVLLWLWASGRWPFQNSLTEMESPLSSEGPTFNGNFYGSVGQQGGETTVNVNPKTPNRLLDDEIRSQLDRLEPTCTVDMMVQGGHESEAFGEEIYQHLRKRGLAISRCVGQRSPALEPGWGGWAVSESVFYIWIGPKE